MGDQKLADVHIFHLGGTIFIFRFSTLIGWTANAYNLSLPYGIELKLGIHEIFDTLFYIPVHVITWPVILKPYKSRILHPILMRFFAFDSRYLQVWFMINIAIPVHRCFVTILSFNDQRDFKDILRCWISVILHKCKKVLKKWIVTKWQIHEQKLYHSEASKELYL